MKRESRISVRLPPDFKQRITDAAIRTGIDEPEIVRQCVQAFCQYVETHKQTPPFPLEFVKPGERAKKAKAA